MPRNEPARLPTRFDTWEEWRETYNAHRADFVAMRIDRVRYRALLSLLGFDSAGCDAEIADGFEARIAARNSK